MYSTQSKAEWHGKRDAYAKAVGGFCVARMGDGTYDYFPTGQPPQTDGNVDDKAIVVAFWNWNYSRWVFVQPASSAVQRIAKSLRRDGRSASVDEIKRRLARGESYIRGEGWVL